MQENTNDVDRLQDYGYLPERFRGADDFDVDAYVARVREIRESGNVPLAPALQTTDEARNQIDDLFSLCGWDGGPINPDNFPCVTNLPYPTPWAVGGTHAGSQQLRERFLKSFTSLADIRKMENKGWLTHGDALFAFEALWWKDHSVVNQINQHDAVMFGIKDDRVDIKKAAKLGYLGHVFQFVKHMYEDDLHKMRLEEDPDGLSHYHIQGHEVHLKTDGMEVFPPSHTGMMFADNIRIEKGDKCFDVGTGSGIHAIVMAQQSGQVVKASDTNQKSAEWAEENAERSNVEGMVSAKAGEFFEGADEGEQFDVIVANMPQTPAEDAGNDSWSEAISAGPDGISILEKLLEAVVNENRLKPNGRLYVCAASIANSQRLRSLIEQNFVIKKVAEQQIRVPSYVEEDNIEYLAELSRQGYNDIKQIGDQQWWYAKDTLLELQLAA